jgi:(1->4)-alpha-D-glucan 1-alpha-D-glucosylmutase
MRIPQSTYRLQITHDFDLATAARTVEYLHELGVDWVYLSPLLTAQKGSAHGYDVADHWSIDPARGGAAGLARLAAKARQLGMGIMVDIVPNHVGIGHPWENRWWWDVLARGRESVYATAFDVDWEAGGDRLLLPVVADADLLEDGTVGHLSVVGDELRYHEQRFPLASGSLRSPGEDANVVHDRQHYQLVGWREADRDLNYRRFFAVNTLAAIRVEDRAWFTLSHGEIRRWFDDGLVDGLRVDHIDGLRAPRRYLDDLAELTGGAYVLVEKILALEEDDEHGVTIEALPPDWATAGTTGYEALALIDRVLVDPAGEPSLTALEDRLRGAPVDWAAMVREGKLAVAHGMLSSEVRRIARDLLRELPAVVAPDIHNIVDGLAEVMAELDVYRTYLPFGVEHLERAFAAAAAARPDLESVLAIIQPLLADPEAPSAQRFQQTSGMVMAKGVEDNSFFRWSRLTSLNEVGGDPAVFSVSVERFHELMAERQRDWPEALTAGTTHDTKRGEDTRARITVLSEVPDAWRDAIDELMTLMPVRDRGFAHLLSQAVVGAWPTTPARLHTYAEKAMREAGEHTWWTAPSPAYEGTFQANVDAIFTSPEVADVLDRMLRIVVGPGRSNALAAKLLSITVPGVPDLYQGSELWEHSLVDPDNRRPVDYGARIELLGQLAAGARPMLTGDLEDDGAVKLLVTRVGLTLRRDHPELFTGYAPLLAAGAAAKHVVAFDRGGAITVVTRLPVGLATSGGWADTSLPLPEGSWQDLVSGREVVAESGATPLATLLEHYPVALLVRRPHPEHLGLA